ncbi:uncharacterized protein LY79DRAFT_589434 [Colletotrichum navitas]|uniref:Ankyrin repeat protein n=1 Tax=Colletotrichum navitas TaxID=681940 RepID=A0AAD8Q172_9PEZI|nr:uncharacterized protein LY79DRAFT_589434 [Colletotrichum navitas]KAK1593977.1 hypothetical protein LY79DRAFT_589434 [Colletotrichum navitas]
MATIEHLPNELLVAIAKSVQDIRGLASMAKMNRRFNIIATSPLYHEAVRRERNDALFHCAGEGLLGALDLLEAAGQDLNVREITQPDSERINGVIQTMCERGEFNIGRVFLEAGRTDEGVIHRAVLKGQAEVVRWLISHGVPVDSRFMNLCECDNVKESGIGSPLHLALCQGQEEVAHILLANGAKIDELEPFSGTTTWQSAIQGRHPVAAMEFALSLASTHSEIFARHADGPKEEKEQINCDVVQKKVLESSNGFGVDSEPDGHSVTEEDILGSVTALLDPIACIEAYADSNKSDAILGQKRKSERMKAHGKLASKKAEHDVIILRQRGAKEPKIHLSPPLRRDTPIKLAYGASVNASDIIGKTFSDTIIDSVGRDVQFLRASLAQYIANSPRVATPV